MSDSNKNAPQTTKVNITLPDDTFGRADVRTDYSASMVVDGEKLSLTLSDGNRRDSVRLVIGEGKNAKIYTAASDTLTTLHTPHKDVSYMAGMVQDAQDSLNSQNGIVNTVYRAFSTTDQAQHRETQEQLAYALRSRESVKEVGPIINQFQNALENKDQKHHFGSINEADFRQIRDAFQRIDHAGEHASNGHLPQGNGQTRGK